MCGGRRKKDWAGEILNGDTVATEAPTTFTRSSGAKIALQSCPQLGEGGPIIIPCTDQSLSLG